MPLLTGYNLETDGRAVAFDNAEVTLVEAHESGSGTLIRLGSGNSTRELHLTAPFEVVLKDITMSDMDRVDRDFVDQLTGSSSEIGPA